MSFQSRSRRFDRLPSSPTPYAPLVSSPLAARYSAGSSPVSYVSSSYNPPNDPVPLSDLPDNDNDNPSSDDTEMQLDDPFAQPDCSHLGQPSIGRFNPTASSSPGPSWLPSLAPPRDPPPPRDSPAGPSSSRAQNHRSAGFKQPAFNSSRRSSSSVHSVGSDPLSSPTPPSRSRPQSGPSPSQLRQQAANRIRAQQRNGLLSSRRILLNAFLAGGQGDETDLTPQEQAMMEAISRKELFNTRQQWKRGFTSIDELLAAVDEELDAMDSLIEESPPEEDDIDPSQIYEAYQLPQPDVPTQPQQQPETWRSLTSLLTSAPATCPACNVPGLTPTDSGVQCTSCAWGLGNETLSYIDQEFLNHGFQPMHAPVVSYNQHLGTTVMCSHAACDEIMAL